MSEPNEPTILFLTDTGSAKLCAMQRPGADPVVISIEIDGAITAAKLPVEQAVALGASLLAANVEVLARFAERMDQRTAQQIAAALLVPTATRGLLGLPGAPEAS